MSLSDTRPDGVRVMSPAAERLLAVYASYMADHGVPPSIREAGAILGITSTAVAQTVARLVRDGHLERVGLSGTARAVRLTSGVAPDLRDEGDRLRRSHYAAEFGLAASATWDTLLAAAEARGFARGLQERGSR